MVVTGLPSFITARFLVVFIVVAYILWLASHQIDPSTVCKPNTEDENEPSQCPRWLQHTISSIHTTNVFSWTTQQDIGKDTLLDSSLLVSDKCKRLATYAEGTWKPLEPTYSSPRFLGLETDTPTFDELDKRLECKVTPDARAGKNETYTRQMERTMRVANYEWQASDSECPLLPMHDSYHMIKELLRMPKGAILVGDSLTKQHKDSLLLMLRSTIPLATMDDKPLPLLEVVKEGQLSVREFWYLNRSHPVIEDLYNDLPPAFLDARLKEPLVTFHWNSHLFNNAVLGDFILKAGGTEATGRLASRYPSYEDYDWVENLVKQSLAGYDDAKLRHPSPLKTLLVIGTGAHWSERVLNGIGVGQTAKIIPPAYQLGVANITETLRAIPKNEDRLRVVYRTTNITPGKCHLYHNPLQNEAQMAMLDWTPSYNYALFPQMDHVWLDHGHEVLNTTLMLGLRPDGRRDPEKPDCLHVCLPVAFAYNRVLFSTFPEQ